MARGHGVFEVLNHTQNPLVRALLRSPAHRLLSGRVALITVTGRRTGRRHTFPVGYTRTGDRVEIVVGWPERKLWWRNLTDGGEVTLLLGGEEATGWAIARGDERSGVTVEVELDGAAARPPSAPAG